MSYAGVGTPVDYVFPEPGATGQVAKRDIIRRDRLGRNVIVVPKGQPVPEGVTLEPGEVTNADQPAASAVTFEPGRHRPEPDIGGQQARRTHLQRMYWLAGRSKR